MTLKVTTTDSKQSWAYGSWDVVEEANLSHSAQMSFTEKVEWLERTARLVRELKPWEKAQNIQAMEKNRS
jgi:allophanate hydrolase subunit 2